MHPIQYYAVIFLGYLSFLFIGIKIENISLTGNIQSPYASAGLVSLKYGEEWKSVCHDGDQKNWGQREAITACRQLNNKGGWPMIVEKKEVSSQHLNNFDCDECKLKFKWTYWTICILALFCEVLTSFILMLKINH